MERSRLPGPPCVAFDIIATAQAIDRHASDGREAKPLAHWRSEAFLLSIDTRERRPAVAARPVGPSGAPLHLDCTQKNGTWRAWAITGGAFGKAH